MSAPVPDDLATFPVADAQHRARLLGEAAAELGRRLPHDTPDDDLRAHDLGLALAHASELYYMLDRLGHLHLVQRDPADDGGPFGLSASHQQMVAELARRRLAG